MLYIEDKVIFNKTKMYFIILIISHIIIGLVYFLINFCAHGMGSIGLAIKNGLISLVDYLILGLYIKSILLKTTNTKGIISNFLKGKNLIQLFILFSLLRFPRLFIIKVMNIIDSPIIIPIPYPLEALLKLLLAVAVFLLNIISVISLIVLFCCDFNIKNIIKTSFKILFSSFWKFISVELIFSLIVSACIFFVYTIVDDLNSIYPILHFVASYMMFGFGIILIPWYCFKFISLSNFNLACN